MKKVISFITLSMITLSMFSCQNESDAIAPQKQISLEQKLTNSSASVSYTAPPLIIIGRKRILYEGYIQCLDYPRETCFILPPYLERVGEVAEVISKNVEGTTYRILQADKVLFPNQD